MKLHALLGLLLCLVARSEPAKATESIVSEGIVSAPVAAVWNAWATAAGLKSRLAPHADIDLRVDGIMRTNYDPKSALGDPGTIENRVLPTSLSGCRRYVWQRLRRNSLSRQRLGNVDCHALPTSPDGKTAVRIVGLGFGSDEESQRMKEFFKQGNAYTLVQLQKRFEQ